MIESSYCIQFLQCRTTDYPTFIRTKLNMPTICSHALLGALYPNMAMHAGDAHSQKYNVMLIGK